MSSRLTAPRRAPSYWEADTYYRRCDALVVGGGLVGLQTALALRDRRPGWRICIVERADPPAGASTRNAGFACVGSLGELADDVAEIGFDATVELVARRHEGLRLLRQRLGDVAMDYRHAGNLELFRTDEREEYARALELLPRMNAALAERLRTQAPFAVDADAGRRLGLSLAGAIRNALEGHLHPGRMTQGLVGLARRGDVAIRRDAVVELAGQSGDYVVRLAGGGELQADRLVLATNAFAARLLPNLGIRPALNQVIVTAPLPELRLGIPVHLERGYGYARPMPNGGLLVGGFRHRFGASAKTDAFGLDVELGRHLRTVAAWLTGGDASAGGQQAWVPRIEYEWSGVLGLGSDRDPRVRVTAEGIVVAAGLGGMGVALGSLLADEAAETACTL